MKRALVLTNFFAAATLAVTSLSSVATAGTIYLDNAINISQYSPTVNPGTPVFVANSGPGIEALAFSSASNVLLAAVDGSSAGIYAYTSASTPSLFAPVADPIGLAIDETGNVYVGANGGTTIEELSPTGAFVKNIATTGFQDDSLAVDSAGNIFEADASGNVIEYFAGGGSKTYSSAPLDGGGNAGITFDSSGDLFVTYVTVCGGGALCGGIDEFSPNGTLDTFYTTNNPPGGVPADVLPVGVAYDPQSGNLYMSYLDSSNGPGGGIDVFVGESSTPSSFATVSSGFPGAITDVTPEPSSILLLGSGLALTLLLHLRGVRRLGQQAARVQE